MILYVSPLTENGSLFARLTFEMDLLLDVQDNFLPKRIIMFFPGGGSLLLLDVLHTSSLPPLARSPTYLEWFSLQICMIPFDPLKVFMAVFGLPSRTENLPS